PVAALSDAMSIETDSFDLARHDINLRECLAYPIADELKRLVKPFIFVTGYGADAIPPASETCGDLRNPVTLRRSQLRSACCAPVCLAPRDESADVSSGSQAAIGT